jgi:hypothetical protein
MSVSMNYRGCSSPLRFIECNVYSGQKFFDLTRQFAWANGGAAGRHVLGD